MRLRLITKAEYDALPPRSQGYAQYWEGAKPGSELKVEVNPYSAGSHEYYEWQRGQQLACQDAQDSEE